ncbi:Omp28-related outer membrane protein [Porphyromonas circumdentaria]|uniref:Omp28-related outer membrane protein n=1 Tax=Porphyromonas circumdentaria TaxID=29524 RepID=UPI0026DCEBDB|nr:Omp28-related outer membrane protein [Porphyromonas circumdentaria]MDO4723049.1 Omp28-related outer membrane protein [Porphyromonas circumdentaria]
MTKKILLLFAFMAFCFQQGLSQRGERFAFQSTTESSTANALRAEDNKIRLGYASEEPGGTFKSQVSEGPLDFGAAVLLKGNILNKYAGSKLTDIEFYRSLEQGQLASFSVFVTKDIGAGISNFLHVQRVDNLKEGAWNRIKLSKEITIEQNTPLYIGIIMSYTNANMPSIQVSKGAGLREAGVNFFLDRNVWYLLDKHPIDYNFAIVAYATEEHAPLNDVGIRRFEMSDFVMQNSPTPASFLLRNYGKSNVKTVTLSAKSDDVEFQKIVIDTLDLRTGSEARINMDGILFPKEGNHNIDLSLISVNGKQDEDDTDNSFEKDLFVIKEGKGAFFKRVLFEQFTSERHKNMPIADSLYAVSINKKKSEVVWIKHHIYEDAYALPYVSDLISAFFENSKSFLPAIAVNRDIYSAFTGERGPAYFINGESFVDMMINTALTFPAFISIEGDVEWQESSNELDIVIRGESAANELPFATDIRLSVYLVEDKILSKTQTGKKEYIQNGVVRAIVSPSVWGEEISLSEYKYQKAYRVKLNPEWKKENLRVVAFVSNYSYDPTKIRVHNADAFGIKGWSSAEKLVEAATPKVWYSSDAVQATEGFEVMAVYDLSGRRHASTHLASGTYVVQLSNGYTQTACKLLVK